MMTDTGTLSPTGRSRIQAALMQAAYGDADLVAEMLHKLPKSRPTMKSVRERLDAMHERTG